MTNKGEGKPHLQGGANYGTHTHTHTKKVIKNGEFILP